MSEKYVKGYFTLPHLLVSNFLLFNVLFWSSIKVTGSQNNKENWTLTAIYLTRGDYFGVKQLEYENWKLI